VIFKTNAFTGLSHPADESVSEPQRTRAAIRTNLRTLFAVIDPTITGFDEMLRDRPPHAFESHGDDAPLPLARNDERDMGYDL